MEIPIIILFSMENGKREHKIAFKAQPSDWAQPHRHPNSKSASSPLWIGMRQQWLIFRGGLTINWFFCNYTKEIPNFHTLILISIQKGGTAAVFASIKGKIASSTATTSSEFKKRIQPIMDGHGPTMVWFRRWRHPHRYYANLFLNLRQELRVL